MQKLTLPQATIGEGVFFIAEIGKNFIQMEEDRPIAEYLDNAKRLVDAAKESGANAVKFQTHELEDEVLNIDFTSPHFKAKDRYSWVKRNTNATPLEGFWKPLKVYCDEKGIIFFSTPMSRKAAVKLNEVGVPMWKVGSGDVLDYLTLNYLLETKKPIIISSGMVSLKELDEVIRYITDRGGDLTVLYCISQYPCPPEYFNLGTIEYLREKYPEITVGFSDHSLTHDAALAAVKLGARVIEKHFSFDRKLWGADHKASILPKEMKELIQMVRSKAHEEIETSKFYGDKNKELEGANNMYRPYFNKALVAGTDIENGTILTEELIYAMRPIQLIKGHPSWGVNDIVGKKVTKPLKKFEPLTLDILE